MVALFVGASNRGALPVVGFAPSPTVWSNPLPRQRSLEGGYPMSHQQKPPVQMSCEAGREIS